MNLNLAFLLAMGVGGPSQPPSNLDFSSGRLAHWQGQGFSLQPATQSQPALLISVDGPERRTALLHTTFHVPRSALAIHFQAAVTRPDGLAARGTLEVVLEGAGREYLPREVREGDRWIPAPSLLPARADGQLREYRWDVSGHVGRRVRIALLDQDDRPGCTLTCTGFRLHTRDQANAQQFVQDMSKLQEAHGLDPLRRVETSHFLALTNADALYAEYRLNNCEMIYPQFFQHFRKRGFELREPGEKLMVAIFSTQAGMDAYMGQKMASSVMGLYHPQSNRLVVYDIGTNQDFLRGKAQVDQTIRAGRNELERNHRRVQLGQAVRDLRDDANISTMMHEVAHQLSFNTGMLNRDGDVPLWLCEGLAVYCESTLRGQWQGIGEANPQRAADLATALKGGNGLIPLLELVRNDDWMRKAVRVERQVLGYAQSWALFRLLIQERPRQLRSYMESLSPRKTAEHRLSDFVAAFGDMKALQMRYSEYVQELARTEVTPRR